MRNCLLLSEENCKLIKRSIKKLKLFRSTENVWHTQPQTGFAQPLLGGVGTCQTDQPAQGSKCSFSFPVGGVFSLLHHYADSFLEKFVTTMKLTLEMDAPYTVE